MSSLPKFDLGRAVPAKAQAVAVASFSPTSWRSYMRQVLGSKGEKVLDTLVDLMEGRPWIPQTADGRIMDPLVPTAEIRLRAAIHLSEMIHGKSVSQTEQVEAEAEASELESIRALSDEELETRVRSALERGISHFDAKRLEATTVEDAPAEPAPTIRDWGRRIFNYHPQGDEE